MGSGGGKIKQKEPEKEHEVGERVAPIYEDQRKQFNKTNALYLIVVASKKTELQNINNHPKDEIDSTAVIQDVKGMQEFFHIHKIESVNHCVYYNSKTNNSYMDLQNDIRTLFSDEDANSVVLYFNGHGDQEGRLFFKTKLGQFSFGLNQLLELWKNRSKNIKHLLLILECCHSGQWVDQLNILKESTISVLASCQANQVCIYTYGVGSFFSDNLQKTYITNQRNLNLVYKNVKFQPTSYSQDYSKLFYYYNIYIEKIDGWSTYQDIQQKISKVVPPLIASTVRGPEEYINQQNQIENDNEEDALQISTINIPVKRQVNMIKRECIVTCNDYLESLHIEQRWVYFKDIYINKKQYAKSQTYGFVVYVDEQFYKFRIDYEGENFYKIAQELYSYWQSKVEQVNKLIPPLTTKNKTII